MGIKANRQEQTYWDWSAQTGKQSQPGGSSSANEASGGTKSTSGDYTIHTLKILLYLTLKL